MEYATTNAILEIVNGLLLVLLAVVASRLAIYILLLKSFCKLTWRDVLCNAPLGVRLALPMFAIKVGAILSLGAVWSWRVFDLGQRMRPAQLSVAMLGVAMLILGGLWLIRTLTVQRSGEWQWLASAGVMLLYVAVSLILHHVLD